MPSFPGTNPKSQEKSSPREIPRFQIVDKPKTLWSCSGKTDRKREPVLEQREIPAVLWQLPSLMAVRVAFQKPAATRRGEFHRSGFESFKSKDRSQTHLLPLCRMRAPKTGELGRQRPYRIPRSRTSSANLTRQIDPDRVSGLHPA